MDIQHNACAPMIRGYGSTRHPWRLGLLVLFLGGFTGGLGEAAVQSCPSPIPAPVLQVGETWQWEDEKGGTGSRSFVSQTDEGLLEARSRPGGPRFFYDHAHTLRKVFRDGAWLTEPNLDLSHIGMPLLQFPLEPRKWWSHQYVGRAGTTRDILTYKQTFTVVGCEQVTVPAGTFLAVVIEEDIGIAGDRSNRGRCCLR